MKILSLSPSLSAIIEYFGHSECLIDSDTLLKPDFVLADAAQNSPDQIRPLEKKFKVHHFDIRSLQDVLDGVKQLGRLLGALEKSRELNDAIRREIKENERVFSSSPPVPVLLLFWYKPFLTVNFDTYASRLLEASGAVNIFRSESKREFEVTVEAMIEKNPSAAFFACDRFRFQKRHLSALKPYRVFSKIPMKILRGQAFTHFGPATVEALKMLRMMMLELRETRPEN